jgi:hypothetical protein
MAIKVIAQRRIASPPALSEKRGSLGVKGVKPLPLHEIRDTLTIIHVYNYRPASLAGITSCASE